MAVKKVIITQTSVDPKSFRPQIAGRIYDDELEPVDTSKYELVTLSEVGVLGFIAILWPEEKATHLVGRVVHEYEVAVYESQEVRRVLKEITTDIHRVWVDADIVKY